MSNSQKQSRSKVKTSRPPFQPLKQNFTPSGTQTFKLFGSTRFMDSQNVTKAEASKEFTQKLKKIDHKYDEQQQQPAGTRKRTLHKGHSSRSIMDQSSWAKLLAKTDQVKSPSAAQHYSKSRKKADIYSGRTINPNHDFYETKDFNPPQSFGGKKSQVKVQNVVTQSFIKPKVKVEKEKISGCLKKSGKQNFNLSHFKFGYSLRELEKDNPTDEIPVGLKLNRKPNNYFSVLSPSCAKSPKLFKNQTVLENNENLFNSSINYSKMMKIQKDFGSKVTGIDKTKSIPEKEKSSRKRSISVNDSCGNIIGSAEKTYEPQIRKYAGGLQNYNQCASSLKNRNSLAWSFSGLNFSSSKQELRPAAGGGRKQSDPRMMSTSKSRGEGLFKDKLNSSSLLLQ